MALSLQPISDSANSLHTKIPAPDNNYVMFDGLLVSYAVAWLSVDRGVGANYQVGATLNHYLLFQQLHHTLLTICKP